MIPLAIPNISGNEGRYLAECVETKFVSSVGPFVTRFERMAADMAGVPTAAAVASGTAALHLALRVLGVGRDDLVLLPAFTFIASANAVSHAGATPWLMDIDPATWVLDARQAAQELRGACRREADGRVVHQPTGRRVGAIMPVQTFGITAGLPELRALADEWGLPLLADAAAAHGSRFQGRAIADWAHLACYSFNGNKVVTAGGGGVIAGADEALVRRARHLSTQARTGVDYDHDEVGFNYRLTNVQAAVGCAQLERLGEFLAAKARIRAAYDAAFAGDARLEPFPSPAGCEHACWFSGFALRPGGASVADVRARLADRGVEARPFWKPVHLQRPYAAAPRAASLAVVEGLWGRLLTLPCSTGLTAGEQGRVIDALRWALG